MKISRTFSGKASKKGDSIVQIKKSMDYSKFAFLRDNRNPDKYVDKLEKAVKINNLSRYVPIIVTIIGKYLAIIEGQTRFLVLKNLGLPIFYIIDEDKRISDEDVICDMNSNVNSWSIEEIIDVRAKKAEDKDPLGIKYAIIRDIISHFKTNKISGINMASRFFHVGTSAGFRDKNKVNTCVTMSIEEAFVEANLWIDAIKAFGGRPRGMRLSTIGDAFNQIKSCDGKKQFFSDLVELAEDTEYIQFCGTEMPDVIDVYYARLGRRIPKELRPMLAAEKAKNQSFYIHRNIRTK